MRLTVVGSAGSVAGPDSAASCYLLEADVADRTWRVVIDLGSGAIGPLQRYCDPARVDAVLVSHGHPDHCADLVGLSVLRRYGPAREHALPRIPLFGPRGLDERIMQVAGAEDRADLAPFDFTALAHGARISFGPFDITAARAWHPVPALAYLIEGPSEGRGRASLMFTGDTDRCDEVDSLAAGADLLLAEAGWAHRAVNPPGIHMTGTQAGELARGAGVGRLLVTHVASWVDPAPTLEQATAVFAGASLAVPAAVHRL
jgi:ribonuclease BN (tRNA processing enzyme)